MDDYDELILCNLILKSENKQKLIDYMITKSCLDSVEMCKHFTNTITKLLDMSITNLSSDTHKKYQALFNVGSILPIKKKMNREYFVGYLHLLEEIWPDITKENYKEECASYLVKLVDKVVDVLKAKEVFDYTEDNCIEWAKSFGHWDYIQKLIKLFIEPNEKENEDE